MGPQLPGSFARGAGRKEGLERKLAPALKRRGTCCARAPEKKAGRAGHPACAPRPQLYVRTSFGFSARIS